jgi:hypothetical protein
LKRIVLSVAVLVCIGIGFLACGSKSSAKKTISGLKFRAFVSNPLHLTTGTSPVLEIVDATKDVISLFPIGLSGSNQFPGLMAESPNKTLTAVFSSQGNTVAVVNNSTEAILQTGSTATSITLPGPTESMFIWIDNATAFAAVPDAPIAGQPSGAVVVLNFANPSIKATLPVPGARYVVQSNDGNRILAFGDNSDAVTIISPSLIGTSTSPLTTVAGFHRPVWAAFNASNSIAYVLNCGTECGDSNPPSITPLDLATNTPGPPLPLTSGGIAGGATTALLSGNTLYVAGTAPGNTCSSGTATISCGTLSVVDVGSMSVTNTSPIYISDGYHNRMELGANGQLFIGAHTCTSVPASSGATARGCLSIFNTMTSAVVMPPDNGDVTGIAPNTKRSVVYVCEGGTFRIYDAATAQLQKTQITIVGQSTDVKIADFPQ